jgi:hypothetical protein
VSGPASSPDPAEQFMRRRDFLPLLGALAGPWASTGPPPSEADRH